MEATALSVGKSVLSGALSYAKSALAEEVALQLGVRRDQLFITNELEMMQAFLMAAHDEGDDNMVVKVWVKHVRDVAYDVEDSLQEFAVRLERQSWWRIRRTLQDRRRVAKQMKDLRANVEDVSQRNMRYHLIKGSGSSSATPGGHSTIDGSTMSGSDESRRLRDKAIVDLVRLINKKDNDLRVIAVSGTSAGDLGETSIIRRAYEDPKINKKFECRAWITGLMYPFNLTEFLRSIIEQFHLNFLQVVREKQEPTLELQYLRKMGMMKEDDLVDDFMRFINEKSYLIVLTNIHTIEEWDHIKPCFQNRKKGSRIIVSAQQVGVASLCVGPKGAVPEHLQLIMNGNIYVFYEKYSQDESVSTETGTSSNADTFGSDSSVNRKMLNRTETMLAASKESQLIGREKEKSEIIKLILDEESQKLEVISLWGMGGLGKTTLVRDVYQDEKLSGKFEKRACATIMRPFNLHELLQNLASQLGYNDVPEMDKELPGKKYLIVLDDLSSNAEWTTIIPHFPAMEMSSRIVVTTRVKDIAKYCSKRHENIYELQCLGHKNSCNLFKQKVFGKSTNLDEQYPELIEQTNMILKKCNGLPLAIVIIGGFLANQPKSVVEWRKLIGNIIVELEMNPELEIIRTVLMKSYDGLPYHLKSCFLYVSIFPEDHKIKLKRLLRRWVAEGYCSVVHNKSAEEIAESYLMELISRSMLLPSQKSNDSREGIDSCQVHDLIREIGISKSMEENLVFRLEEGCSSNTQGTTRHLAINGNWEGDQSEFESLVDLSRVRSVTVFGEWKSFFISDKMSLLRVLDLEDTTGLHDHHLKHIGKLLHLRYLSLRGCEYIFHLPDSLGNLGQLETLDIRDTGLVFLPKSIVKLGNLKNIQAGKKPSNEDVSSAREQYYFSPEVLEDRRRLLPLAFSLLTCLLICKPELAVDTGFNRNDSWAVIWCDAFPIMMMCLEKHGVLVPRGMRKLKALQTLGIVNIAEQGKVFLREMKGLTRLCKLAVTGINKENGQGFCAAIVGLIRLESLSIRSEGEPGLSGCLDGVFPFPKNLRSLRLYGKLPKLPQWIKGLNNLLKLKLRNTQLLDIGAAMKVLGNLPDLASLHLSGYCFQETECDVSLTFPRVMFLRLVVLELDYVYSINSVEFEEGATPKLELLKFFFGYTSPKVGYFSGFFSGLEYLPSLNEFMLDDCYKYEDYFMEELQGKLAANQNAPVLKRFSPIL